MVFISLTCLAISHSMITNKLNIIIIGILYNVFLYYRDDLVRYASLFKALCGFGVIGIVLAFFSKKTSFENIIFSVFWILVIFGPIFVLKISIKSNFWIVVLILGIMNIIGSILSNSQISTLIFPILLISLMYCLYSGYIFLGSTHEDGKLKYLWRGYGSNLLLALPGGALVSLIIFFAFPRMHNFPFNFGLQGAQRVGYSGEINLMGGGELKKNSEIVMYVESNDTRWLRTGGAEQLFRGKSLSGFNGSTWVDLMEPLPLAGLVKRSSLKNLTNRLVTIHKMGSEVKTIFYPGTYLGVWFSNSQDREVFNSVTGELSLLRANSGRNSFTISFGERTSEPKLNDIALTDLKQEVSVVGLEAFLSIPQVLSQSSWFSAWVREISIDSEQTLFNLTQAISEYFKDKYQVTLENKFTPGDALREFAVETKKGHCEFFATSAAMMLRAWGVPSRVVLGFRGGTFNSLLEMLEVRTDDAHAWTEYWHPEYGWIPLDPTPSTNDGGGGEGFFSTWKLYISAADFLLKRYVADYDGNVQREILKNFSEIVTKDNLSFEDFLTLLKSNSAPGLVVILILLIYFLVVRHNKSGATIKVYPDEYELFLRKLRKIGIQKDFGETIRSFHERLLGLGFDGALLARLTLEIESYLYASRTVDKKDPEVASVSQRELVNKILKSHGETKKISLIF